MYLRDAPEVILLVIEYNSGIWRYLAVFGGIWRYLAVFGGIWRYLAVFGICVFYASCQPSGCIRSSVYQHNGHK